MFWTIVLALLFVFVCIPVIIVSVSIVIFWLFFEGRWKFTLLLSWALWLIADCYLKGYFT